MSAFRCSRERCSFVTDDQAAADEHILADNACAATSYIISGSGR